MPQTKPGPVALIALYLAAIVAATLTVAWFGPAVTVINAFLFIGLDLTTRDALHDLWGRHGRRGLWLRQLALIAAGGALSAALNWQAAPIALASCVAFVLAGAADAAVYGALGGRGRLLRVNGSNVVGAAVDSLIFPTIAFGGLLWPIVIGQFVAKVAGGLLWSLVLRPARREAPDAA